MQFCVLMACFQDYQDVCRPHSCSLIHKSLKKHATSWVHKFKLDPAMIQSIHLEKCSAALAFLIKTSGSDEMSKEAWLEGVSRVIVPFPEQLQSMALRQLSGGRWLNIELLVDLMKLWNISVWNGRTVEEYISDLGDWEANQQSLDAPIEYYPLKILYEEIEVVDRVERFHAALSEIEEDLSRVVGVDCEWNSSRTGFEQPKLALLQIALKSHVYLFDVFTLSECKYRIS